MIHISLRSYFSLVLVLFVSPFLSQGQTQLVDPYSSYGIGDMQNQGGVQSFSMGQTGIAMHNDSTTPFFINLKNPASYFYNRITTFEAGVLNNDMNLSGGGITHNNDNAYFGYFSIAFPMTKWLGGCLGLTPMSSSGFNISSSSPLDSIAANGQRFPVDNVATTYTSSGGVDNVFLGFAASPKKHHVSIGLNICYLFGNISSQQNVDYPSNYNAFGTQSNQTAYIKGFYLNYGLMLTIGKASGFNVTLGVTGALGQNIYATYNLLSVNYMNGIVYDTIQDSNSNGKIHLPWMLGGGITIKKGEKWTFNFDYSMQNWSQFTYLGQSQNLRNNTQYGFGVQYIPHKNFDAPGTYFKRVHYRAGFSYTQTYLNINNMALTDYNASIGFGFPIGPNAIQNRTSMLNIGVQVGQLGTTADNLVQERYFKILVGFTFDDRWFVKRQFE